MQEWKRPTEMPGVSYNKELFSLTGWGVLDLAKVMMDSKTNFTRPLTPMRKLV